MIKRIIFSLMLFIFLGDAFGQEKTIFLVRERYDSTIDVIIRKSNIDFRNITMIYNDVIDPRNDGLVDYTKIDRYLNKILPDRLTNDLICIDFESEYYNDLKGNILTYYKRVSKDKQYRARSIYVDIVKYIKKIRPNAKVGIYGMPFKAYYGWQYRQDEEQNLDSILTICDVLFPSIYSPYLPTEEGIKDNLDFFKLNLGYAFSYAVRLNKPVIPFFWYLTWSQNSGTRFELIPKQTMKKYLEYIENYKSPSGIEISGVVWWEDIPELYSRHKIKNNFLETDVKWKLVSPNRAFFYYFK